MNVNRTLFRHAWLSFVRSKGLGHKLLETALLAFLGLNLAVTLSVAGLVGGSLLETYYPDDDSFSVGMGFIFLYFCAELIVRYFFQKFPVHVLRPYLVLPLPRRILARVMLRRSFLSIWTLLPWFLIVPFYFTGVRGQGLQIEIGYFFIAGVLAFSSHLLAFIAVAVRTQAVTALAGLAGTAFLLWAELSGRFSAALPVGAGISAVIGAVWVWPLVAAVPAGLYRYLRTYFTRTAGEETLGAFERNYGRSGTFGFFGKYGPAGELVDMEVRLVLRNKRARQYFVLSLVTLLLPILLIQDSAELSNGLVMALAFVLTGMATLNHGQLALSWNSFHMDFLLTRGQSFRQIFLGKYYFLALTSVLTWLLTLPYSAFVPGLFWAAGAMLLINATVSGMVYLLVAGISSLKIDPDEGGAFSMSGFGVVHYLITLPIIAVPAVLYLTGNFLGGHVGGLIAVAGFGALLLALHRPIIGMISAVFAGNRYRISAVLRDK